MKSKEYKKNSRDAELVERLAGLGLPLEQIGAVLGPKAAGGISGKTVSTLYQHEILVGKSRANGKVSGALFEKAMSGDTICMLFWMKSQAGWAEAKPKEDIEATHGIVSAVQTLVQRLPN